MVAGEKRERFWVTLGAALLSLFFMAPADIVEVSLQYPHGRFAGLQARES